jgi:hypothetical protein
VVLNSKEVNVSRKVDWPPKAYKTQKQSVAGEPAWIYLRQFKGDSGPMGRLWETCCGCGMEHLFTYDVFRERSGKWWLIKRPYLAGESLGWRNQHRRARRKGKPAQHAKRKK